MKIKFIINPISGTGKQKGIDKLISRYFDEYDIVFTTKQGDAKKYSIESINKYDLVVSVGGDGTLNECASGLVNSNTVLGVIPCGSGNGFAYHLGMSKNIVSALKQLKNGHIQNVDVCSVNKNNFINVSGIGFDSHIAYLFSKLKSRGFINYIKLIIKELNYVAKKFDIEYDSIKKSVYAYMISFANASQYGNNARISPNSNISDGLISFVIVKKFPKWKIPFFLYKIMKGNIHKTNYVEIIKTKEMIIYSTENIIHLDGEVREMNSPLKVKISKDSLKILAPNEKK